MFIINNINYSLFDTTHISNCFHSLAVNNNGAMIGLINKIASTGSPMPGLTQDDSKVQYCDSDNLPSNCNSKTICHCPHLVQLELCKVYEFFLYDGGRKEKNLK